MHLRHLLVRDCKLMRRLEVPFVRPDDSPRMWTVFVGANGLCKTTLLRAIAIAAAGPAFANNLVDDAQAYVDLRSDGTLATVDATFGFSPRAKRTYPRTPNQGETPVLAARATLSKAGTVHHASNYGERFLDGEDDERVGELNARRENPLALARDEAEPLWFVAGYGAGRALNSELRRDPESVPPRERLRSLFDHGKAPHGLAFADMYERRADGGGSSRSYRLTLQRALDSVGVPGFVGIDTRPDRGPGTGSGERFDMFAGQGPATRMPAHWLSQGVQSVVSLVADIIGHAWLDAAEAVQDLTSLSGVVLVDELDLHLHPTWQTSIVEGLKRTFPNLQFIVTTHSPLVLTGCRTDEVWTLVQDPESGDVVAQESHESPMVMTGSELNREFFGVDRASPLGEDLRRYVELASDPFRSDADDRIARGLLAKLQANEIPVDYRPVPRKSVS